MADKKFYYSEAFNSIQGEGKYTGINTAWIRFFLCNLQCDGFGQKEPTDPDSYELPYEDFDPSKVKIVEDLPVWEFGCDSSYTWSKKFRHLMHHATATEMAKAIRCTMVNEFNPHGYFWHPNSGEFTHMAFTGGEPLLKHAQRASVDIMREFEAGGDAPTHITYETNGTTELMQPFIAYWQSYTSQPKHELFFSVSPKLWTVAGEKPKRAIRPEIVAQYYKLSPHGQLKFVMGDREEQWEELEGVIKAFRGAGVKYPVYIMPVGATLEEQEASAGKVAKMAFDRGYNVSGRLHCHIFGNSIGT